MTSRLLIPFIVSAATIALTTASSVACMALDSGNSRVLPSKTRRKCLRVRRLNDHRPCPSQVQRVSLRASVESELEEGVGGYDDDNGTNIISVNVARDFVAHGHSGKAWLAAPSIIALRHLAHRLADVFDIEHAGGASDRP